MQVSIPIFVSPSYLGNNQQITEKSNDFVKITCRVHQSGVNDILVYLA